MQIGRRAAVLAGALLAACSAPIQESRPDSTPRFSAPPPPVRREPTGIDSVVEAAGLAAKAVAASAAKRVGILEIRGLDGRRTMLGRFLAEEITTAVQRTRTAAVVERRLIDEMMSEGKFSGSGFIDDSTAAELGGKLGADAVLAGTLTEFGDELRFNMRVITTKAGQVASAEQATIRVDAPLRKLWGQEVSDGAPVVRGAGPSAADAMRAKPAIAQERSSAATTALFYEDFRDVEEGLVPDGWSTDTGIGIVRAGTTKCLGQLQRGDHKVTTPPLKLPSDFAIELNALWGRNGYMNQEMTIAVGKVKARVGGGYDSDEVALTNASTIRGPAGPYEGKRTSFVLEKRGPVFRLFADGNQLIIGRVPDFTAHGSMPIIVEASSLNFCIFSLTVRSP